MDKKLVSVIIPVYNSESYLEKCINSVLKQDYLNFELLLINDGSNDNSLEICEKFSKIDSRIVFINKSNGGASSARNEGLNKAQGEWVCFIDSDDYVEQSYISHMIDAFPENNLSLVICGMKVLRNHNVSEFKYTREFVSENLMDDLSKKDFFRHGGPTSKLFLRKILVENNISFDTTLRNYEDLIFCLSYISHIKSIVYLDNIDYIYAINNVSMAHSYNGFEGELHLMKLYENSLLEISKSEISDCKIWHYKNCFLIRAIKSMYFSSDVTPYLTRIGNLRKISKLIILKFSYGESLMWKLLCFFLKIKLLIIVDLICVLLKYKYKLL